ncbi:reverse transcriptase domain-containing protein [Tanacetum coccineum]
MPSHIKTYDGSEDPEDHLKIFQAAAKTERWAMPTWCHMFNSTLTGNARVWFDDLPAESIDSYDDLKKAFLENYLQQKKYIKDPIELHNIKQRDGESTEDFVRRYKLESRDVKGAPECMRISGFVHGITNPELIKRLHDKIPKTVDEMMRVTTSFLRGEVAASNHERKKSFPPWKQQEGTQRQNFKKGGFRNQQRSERKQDRFTLLTKTPKEIFALEKGKFKAPPPMTTLVEKRNHTKFCEFHGEVGHNTDEYEDEGTEGPMIIEAEIGGHCIHHMIGDEEHFTSAWMNFVVVSSPSPYNGIIGRQGVRKLQAVLSTAHGMLKLPVEGGVITLKSSRLVSLECALVSRPEETPQAPKPMVEERVKVAINPEYTEQTIMIGPTFTEEGRNKLCNLLQCNLDIFAWKPADMTSVPRHIAKHCLNVREGCSLVMQKKRGQAADRIKQYRKKLESFWRMCVDFKDLKCFLDAYKGYHQIQMAKEDEEKIAFITSQGIFCYTKMPFGLKNAGATYQRLVDKAFPKQIGRNLEVYMDDLVIKSRTKDEIIRDIEETFKTLREINMKLNSKKCYLWGRRRDFLRIQS